MKELELAVVGAGPAGLSAAIEAARAGVRVTLFDENQSPGGQIFRQYPQGFQVTDPKVLGQDFRRGQELLTRFRSIADEVDHRKGAVVWGLFPDRELAFVQNQTSLSVRYQKLILATGAYDRPVCFPGWTLPGVLTAGGTQVMIKTQRVLPGKRFLLAGTGPLQLTLANQITAAGGKVIGVCEAGRVENKLGLIRALLGQWSLLFDGWRYWRGMQRAGIPLLREHLLLEARGREHVEEVVIARVDRNWRPIPGTERTFSVDTICIGYGFVSSSELTRLAGCKHTYEQRLGGWIPVRGTDMETDVHGIYAVGDCAGVAGRLVAADEGRIAGIAAAASLGYLSTEEAKHRQKGPVKRLTSHKRLRDVLDEISRPRPGLYELAEDETIVCRCEDISLGDIRKALSEGAVDLNEIKRMTRAGMGHCQGRMCGPGLLEIMAMETGRNTEQLASFHLRPPVKPVPLPLIASHTNPEI
ncbi:MAG: FAD-dependent oxidoreductase [Spirochaetales bacterium]|nr:FAD-dependent oxidoreductase [Spirochaetales bacterium]